MLAPRDVFADRWRHRHVLPALQSALQATPILRPGSSSERLPALRWQVRSLECCWKMLASNRRGNCSTDQYCTRRWKMMNDRKWMDSVWFGRFRFHLVLLSSMWKMYENMIKICWSRMWLGSCSDHLSRNTKEEVAAVRDALEIDIDVDSGAFTGISHHGQICSIAALPTVKMGDEWECWEVHRWKGTAHLYLPLPWYLIGTWCSEEKEREREAESWQRASFNLYSVTVRYLQAAVRAAEQHVCKYWLQQHEA